MNETIAPGLRLEMRKTSPFIQVVVKEGDGRWSRHSSKTTDREEAIRFAHRLQVEFATMQQYGIPARAKRFDDVARDFLKELARSRANGTAKASQRTYVDVTQKWLLPFFGSYVLPKIDDGLLARFEDWRLQELGYEPAKSTINKHNIVLRAVLEHAVKNSWMKRADIPKLTIKNKGVDAQRRGFFEYEEWNKLSAFLHNWPQQGHKALTKYKRNVLATYVYLLTMSGLRPGAEADNLRWRDIEAVPGRDGTISHYRLHIRFGKNSRKGGRTVHSVAHRPAVVDTEMVLELEHVKFLRTTEVLPDDLVFCMPDGSPIRGFSAMFRQALDLTGLRYGINGEGRSLYSLRHTYATWNLRRGVTYPQLKTQLGTSVHMLNRHYDHATADTWAHELLLGQTRRAR